MRKIFIAASILSLLLPFAKAHAFGGCEEDCQKCHSLQTGEAQQILERMQVPDSKVVDIKMSPVKGLWEVTVADARGARKTMYVGFSKKYIMGGPIIEVGKIQQEPVKDGGKPAERYLDTSVIPVENDLLLGSRKAPNKVVVFTDPD